MTPCRDLIRCAAPLAALIVIAAVCFAPLIAHPSFLMVDGNAPSVDHAKPGDPRGLGNDATYSFVPLHLWIARTITQFGHVPAWDSRGFGGRPLYSNPQSGVFYPPVWIAWVSGAPAALGWITVAHLIWGGIGIYVLVRSLNVGPLGATLAAATYQASPLLLAHTFEGHYPHVWAACWYPWAFWTYRRLRSGDLRRGLFLAPILAATLVVGHPQEALLLSLTLMVWTLADVVKSWRDGESRRGALRMTRWLTVLIMAAGIAAVHLVPEVTARAWLADNSDAPRGSEIPRRYHVEIFNAWQLLSPTALGDPSHYFGADNYWETVLSIGLVPLLLALLGAVKHPDRGLVRGWLFLALIAIWFACGRHLLLFALAYRVVPGIGWFRVPARALFLANVAGAVMAGLGVDVLRTRFTRPRDWQRFATIIVRVSVVLVVTLLAIRGFYQSDRPSRTAAAINNVLGGGGFWVSLCGIALMAWIGSGRSGPELRRWAVPMIVLLAVGELSGYGYRLVHVCPPERFLGQDNLGTALARLALEKSGSGPLRIKARDAFYGDLRAIASGIEKTNINDIFQIKHSALVYQLLYPVGAFQRRRLNDAMQDPVDLHKREIRQAVFDRLGVSYLVSDRFERDPGWPAALEGSLCSGPWMIQRNPSAMPRAYVVPKALPESADPHITIARFREVDPRDAVLMPVDPFAGTIQEQRQSFKAATWSRAEPDNPVIEVDTVAPGLLVISNTWMPGWTAEVDDRLTPVYRGDLCQQVVPLERGGHHKIALHYNEPGFRSGSIISMVAIVAWLIIYGASVWTSKEHWSSANIAKTSTARRAMGP